MKMVVDLPEDCGPHARHRAPHPRLSRSRRSSASSTSTRTGWPRSASSCRRWFESPVRTTYRYLQHWMQHPCLWRHLKGGRLRSWGAKSLLESGRRGEPFLAGDGFARIGEGSGSTNVLTGSGVDEAWATGVAAGRGRDRAARGRQAVHPREPRAGLRRPPPRRAGSSARPRWPRGRATASRRAWSPGLLGMALAGLTGGRPRLAEAPPHPAETRRHPGGLLRRPDPAGGDRPHPRASARPGASRSTTP